jgi:hypothetical protein
MGTGFRPGLTTVESQGLQRLRNMVFPQPFQRRRAKGPFFYGKGLRGWADCAQQSSEAAVCREGNAVRRLRREGVGRAGLVAVEVPIKILVRGRRGRVGLGFGIAWLFTSGLVLLFSEPRSGVNICGDGRGRGLGPGWGGATVRHQSLDSYDRKSFDLAGDGASTSGLIAPHHPASTMTVPNYGSPIRHRPRVLTGRERAESEPPSTLSYGCGFTWYSAGPRFVAVTGLSLAHA